MTHVHGALYRERGLLTSAGKEITSGEESFILLEGIWLPKRLAIVRCKEHQEGGSSEARGNRTAHLSPQEVILEQASPLQVLIAMLELIPSRARLTGLHKSWPIV